MLKKKVVKRAIENVAESTCVIGEVSEASFGKNDYDSVG